MTVSAQSYQNYKSALKWWYECYNADYDKVGANSPSAVDKQSIVRSQVTKEMWLKRILHENKTIWS